MTRIRAASARVSLGVVLWLALVPPAAAQMPVGATTANPAVATQRVEQISTPRPLVPRSVDPSKMTTDLAIEGATSGDSTRFFVRSIVFEGAGKLPEDKLRKAAAVLEGRDITLGQLHILARRVRLIARQAGLLVATARVPPQQIRDGIVRIVVSEGRFGTVKARGGHYYSEQFVRRFFAPATAQGFVSTRELYRSLLILNEFADLTVQAQFTAGRAQGTTDVILSVKDTRPVHVIVDYNNFGSRLVGRNRAGTTFVAGNQFTEGDEVLVRGVDSWPGRSHVFWNAGYTVPVGDRGTKLAFQFADAETHVRGGALTQLDINGDANIYTLAVAHPFTRTFTVVQNISANLSAKTIKNFFFGNTLTSQDDLRVLTLGTDGAIGDRNGRWIYNVSVGQGLGDLLGGKKSDEPLGSRVGAGNDFAKLNVDVLRNLDLKKNRFLLIRAGLQLSTDPVPTAEQYGIGGPDSVRGFIQSEALGDEGYTISAEYRHQIYRSKKGTELVQAVAFLDHGHVDLINPQVLEREERKLTGYGAGLRAAVGPRTSFRLDLGMPLNMSRNADGDDVLLYVQSATRF